MSFDRLIDNLNDLAGVMSSVTKEASEIINVEIQDQFSRGCDAYGNPWQPLLPQTIRRKGGDSRILIQTGTLSQSTVAKPMGGAGIEITSVDVGQYHQSGTVNMVSRPILPDESDLPDSWIEAIQTATEHAVKRAMR